MLRRDTQHLGHLPVVFCRVAVQGDGLLGQIQWGSPVAERGVNLREQEIGCRIARRLNGYTRPLPMSGFDQLLCG